MTSDIEWKEAPDEHDYPAAGVYLDLTYAKADVTSIVDSLRNAGNSSFAAKDILRASGLASLDTTNAHVRKDSERIRKGEALSPVLLVRDSVHGRVVIADGYHRVCAAHLHDENAVVPCRIV